MIRSILILSFLILSFLPSAYSKESLVAELNYPACPDRYELIAQSVLQGRVCLNKLCLGDTVEVLKAAGNNIDVVIGFNKKGTSASVMNRNNCASAIFPVSKLKKLGKSVPVKCKKKDRKVICRGDYVKVKGPLGTGDAQVQVLEVYSNKTATVNNMTGDQQATYLTSRFTKIKKPTTEVMPKDVPQTQTEPAAPVTVESVPQIEPDVNAPSILDTPLDPK